MIKVIKDPLPNYEGYASLVQKGDDYYVVSTIIVPTRGILTFAFEADKEGKITNWNEVAGGYDMGQQATIDQLDSRR